MITRTFIVGNGFIHHLKSLAEKEYHTGNLSILSLIDELNQVSQLFKEFDDLNQEIATLLGIPNSNMEQALKVADNIIAWFRTKSVDDEGFVLKDCQNSINEIGKKLIDEKILPITSKFEEQENNGFYGRITQWVNGSVGNQVLKWARKKESALGIFTTNYDGVLEQLLRSSDKKDDGYWLTDGFAGSPNHPLTHYDPKLDSNCFIGHLHSSYKYGWQNGKWIKYRTSEEEKNEDPLILYMNPTQKLEFIKANPILRAYWEKFCEFLKKSDELVIYGNSLEADPHIAEAIKKHLKKSCKILILDKDSEKIKKTLEEQKIKNKISPMSLEKITKKNLWEVFVQPKSLVI